MREFGMMQECPQVSKIIKVMESKDYLVFNDPKGHDLNIVGIRTADMEANKFNDWLTVFYIFDSVWNYFAFPATTDPGTYYRNKPLNVKGTAVMKPGQYRGAYKIGKHRNYKALQQSKPIIVYRDANRDNHLDTTGVEEESGMFGINIHRSGDKKASTIVHNWSAGCQVFQDPDHFDFLMTLCDRGKDKFGNSFTYTLLEEEDFS